jgi:hypothetical protein
MQKVFFVGLHNKPGMQPLDSATKTGQLIDAIIQFTQLPAELFVKTNLYKDDVPPDDEKVEHAKAWYNIHQPADGSVIVLLGKEVRQNFIILRSTSLWYINLDHPGAIARRGAAASLPYIHVAVDLIKKVYHATI